jgi:hypothetical protein
MGRQCNRSQDNLLCFWNMKPHGQNLCPLVRLEPAMTFDIHLSNLNRITKPNVGLSKCFERLVLSGPLFRNAPQEIDRSFFSICHAARKTKAESPVYVRYRSADLSSGLGDEGFKGLGKGVAPHTLHIPRARGASRLRAFLRSALSFLRPRIRYLPRLRWSSPCL